MEPAATPAAHGTEWAAKPPGSGLSAHILPASATMIGVCMTVLSIGHLGPAGEWRMVIDKLLAVDALVFLVSALLSFMSMRLRGSGPSYEALGRTRLHRRPRTACARRGGAGVRDQLAAAGATLL